MRLDAGKAAMVLVLAAAAAVVVLVLRHIGRPAAPSSTFFASATQDDLSRQMLRPEGRAATARRLGEDKPPDAVKFLVPYLRDPDAQVRIACAEALAKIEDRSVRPDLEVRLEEEADPEVRNALAKALVTLSDATLALKLARELDQADAAARLAAVKALEPIRDNPEAIGALVKALADADADVREVASELLVRTGDLCFQRLQGAARQAGAEMIRRIVAVLVRMRSSDTVPVFLSVLAAAKAAFGGTEDYDAIRKTALEAMVGLGEPAVISLCRLAFFQTGDEQAKQLVAEALTGIGGAMTVFQVRTCALEWERPPAAAEVAMWLKVVDSVGGEQARQARVRIEQHVTKLQGRAELGAAALELEDVRLSPIGQPVPAGDAENGIYALILTGALKPGRSALPLTIHLDRRDGRFVRAFASARSYNQTSHEVDASELKVEGGQISGIVRVTIHPDMFVPADGKTLACEYAVVARADGAELSGMFGGKYGAEDVRGKVLGLLQRRPKWPETVWFHVNLPGGLDGLHDHYWHNAWASFLLSGGRTYDGQLTAYDQLAAAITHNVTWGATVRDVTARFDGETFQAAIKAQVETYRGPEISFGPHTFDLAGQAIGKVVAGRFRMSVEETFLEEHRFVGTIKDTVPYDPALRNALFALALEDALDGKRRLGIALDRLGGQFRMLTRMVDDAPIWSDVSGLDIQDRVLKGSLRLVTICPDTGETVASRYALQVEVRHTLIAGTYEGTYGDQKVAGSVSGDFRDRLK